MVALITLEPQIVQFYEADVVTFQVIESTEGESARGDYAGDISGAIRPLLKWSTVSVRRKALLKICDNSSNKE